MYIDYTVFDDAESESDVIFLFRATLRAQVVKHGNIPLKKAPYMTSDDAEFKFDNIFPLSRTFDSCSSPGITFEDLSAS